MDYVQRLRRSDTEENTEFADLRARVQLIDLEIEINARGASVSKRDRQANTKEGQFEGRIGRHPQSVQATT